MTITLAQCLIFFAGSLLACTAVYRALLRNQVLDHPNARSSHSRPTPRGGGLGFVPVVSLGLVTMAITGDPDLRLPLAMLAALAVGLTIPGILDDLRGLDAAKRLAWQLLSSVLLVSVVLFSHFDNSVSVQLVAGLFIAGVFFSLWSTNLYNFMDGIDGLAAIQAILSGMLVFLLDISGWYPGILANAGLITAACCLAFLLFNFPPAKMFMGDTGSAALGFIFSGIALIEFSLDANAFWIWVILLAGFIADATATLLVRLCSGQKIYQAHRTHLYQLFTARATATGIVKGLSGEQARTRAHRRYLLVFSLMFIFWQVPPAVLVGRDVLPGFIGAIICLAPLISAAVVLGVGRAEKPPGGGL